MAYPAEPHSSSPLHAHWNNTLPTVQAAHDAITTYLQCMAAAMLISLECDKTDDANKIENEAIGLAKEGDWTRARETVTGFYDALAEDAGTRDPGGVCPLVCGQIRQYRGNQTPGSRARIVQDLRREAKKGETVVLTFLTKSSEKEKPAPAAPSPSTDLVKAKKSERRRTGRRRSASSDEDDNEDNEDDGWGHIGSGADELFFSRSTRSSPAWGRDGRAKGWVRRKDDMLRGRESKGGICERLFNKSMTQVLKSSKHI